MQIQIALDPALELSAADFADAWNAEPPIAAAPASVAASGKETFLSPELATVLVSAAVSIPAAVIANFVTEYLKKTFLEKKAPKVTVTTISTPDGQPLLVVKQNEE